MTTKAIFLTFLLLIAAVIVRGDIPVHCLKDQVLGTWSFTLDAQDKTAADAVKICTMKTPVNETQTLTLKLSEPNIVIDTATQAKGTWTLIYDEGFEIVVNGLRFFAFFQYERSGGKVISHCNLSYTGVFHEDHFPRPQKWGCFSGKQKENAFNQSPKVVYDSDAETERQMKERVFANNPEYIRRLNEMQSSWTAAPYEPFEGLPMSDIFAASGAVKVNSFKRRAHERYMRTERAKRNLETLALRSRLTTYPQSFDWRNVSGENYVSPVRNQQQCGSCYIFGATGVIQDRVRIMTKNQQQPVLSTQQVVDCANPIFAQGCDGGFVGPVAHFVGSFGQTHEECYPYRGLDQQCKAFTCSKPSVYISGWHYIGNYYGGCTEEGMIEDLLEKGPLSIGIMVYSDFMHYRGGIYHHVSNDLDQEFHSGWEPINHAVQAVGIGVSESGEKYWIVKNSWGAGWGLNGYILIRRGTDEIAIESNGVSVTPSLS